MNDQKQGELHEIAALWVSKNNPHIMTGKLGNSRLVLMPNKFKKSENHPDYILCTAKQDKVDKPASRVISEEDLPF